mmetsp:Transcript_95296/g.307587  ORF Transcript_95296/g.307587 Transcript_95296/m.307587 type:complete len:276 (+) Transcript_95296:2-829(+)
MAPPSACLQLHSMQRLIQAVPGPVDADARARRLAPPTGEPFVVVAAMANVRELPKTDAKKLAVLGRGDSVCGEVKDGWLHLDAASLDAHGLGAVASACVLLDGSQLGLGPLLLPSDSARASVARLRRWRRGARVQVAAVLALAPVADLVRGHELRVSDEGDAVELYMGRQPSGEGLAEYGRASPAALLPVDFPLLVAYGDQDQDVPPALVRDYAEAAREGAPELVSVVEAPGADHFDVVDAGSAVWLEQIVPSFAAILDQELGEAAAMALLGLPA